MNCNVCSEKLVVDDRIEGLFCNNQECRCYRILI